MLITDKKKVVEIEIRAIEDDYRKDQDITQNLILDDGYTCDRVTGMWLINDVDYCVSQVKDMMDGKGDWADDGPILDAELTINLINSKTDDFSVAQLMAICNLAREGLLRANSSKDEDMYLDIEDIAMSMLLGN